MNLAKKLSLLPLLILFSVFSYSKPVEQDSIISISGQVVNSKTFAPIPLATVTIKRSRKGTICDSVGVFHLQIKQSDTLKISALGYKEREWPVPLIINPDFPPFFQIKLHDVSYLLDEVDIYALGTWDEFKEDFINTELKEKDPINKDIKEQLAPYNTREPNIVPAQYRPKREKLGVLDAVFSPTDFLHGKLSKREKIKRKLAKTIREEGKNKKISEKYNAEIVSEATELTGDELVAFMEFCGANINVNENSTEYDVMKQILEWFEKWKKEQ